MLRDRELEGAAMARFMPEGMVKYSGAISRSWVEAVS